MAGELGDQPPHRIILDGDEDRSMVAEGRIERRPSRAIGVLLALGLVALITWLGQASDEALPAEVDDVAPATSVPVEDDARPPGSTTERDGGRTVDEGWSIDRPLLTDAPRLIVVDRVDDELVPWSVDLEAGRAEPLPLPAGIDPASLLGVRYFPGNRLVAHDREARYHLLRVDDDELVSDRVVDIGPRRTLGVDGLSPEGDEAWLIFDAGLIRWRLWESTIDARWIDRFGDRTSLPDLKGVVVSGAVVQGGARSYLVGGSEVDPLDLSGEVVATAGDWLVVRSCDDEMRCGRLDLVDVGAGATVSLSPDYRFRTTCGLATAGAADGTLHVVVERLGTLVLLTVGPDHEVREVDLHPAGIGCVDAVAVGPDLVVVGHRRAVSLVDLAARPEPTVELVNLDGLHELVVVGPISP